MNNRQWAMTVWLVHGLLDGVVTIAAVVHLEDTTIESNPILRSQLLEAFRAYTWTGDYLVFAQPLLFKLTAVGAASVLLLLLAHAIPRRAYVSFSALLSVAGLVVVGNNVVSLLL